MLPYVDIDYVSYSAYDIQALSTEQIQTYLERMESALKPRDVPGKRVFIGETALPAILLGNREERHNEVNVSYFIKYFEAGAPQILFWQMYNNEEANGKQQGYWLIDNNNHKWKLYYTYKAFYCNAREYVRSYVAEKGTTPDAHEYATWAISFLNTLK